MEKNDSTVEHPFYVYDLYDMRIAYNIQLDFKRIIYDILTLCKLQTKPFLLYRYIQIHYLCTRKWGRNI